MSTMPAAPDWLRGLIRGIAREGIKPRDPRVQQLWNLLRSRALLARSEWVRPAPLHVGEGPGDPAPSQDHATAQGVAAELGDPAPGLSGDGPGRRDTRRRIVRCGGCGR